VTRYASLLAVLLTGCATAPQIVRVAVPVSCVVEMPAAPTITANSELRAMGDYRLLLTIARERLVLIGHAGELRAVVEGCQP